MREVEEVVGRGFGGASLGMGTPLWIGRPLG